MLTDEEVQNALTVLKKRLQPLPGDSLAKLVLYGSRARGDADSDVDVAIVVQGPDAKVRDRIPNAVDDVELETLVPLSTIVFSEAEYQRLRAGERRIALDIEGEGIAL